MERDYFQLHDRDYFQLHDQVGSAVQRFEVDMRTHIAVRTGEILGRHTELP